MRRGQGNLPLSRRQTHVLNREGTDARRHDELTKPAQPKYESNARRSSRVNNAGPSGYESCSECYCISSQKEYRMTHKIAACLWFDGNAEDAARFYEQTFPESRIDAITRSPSAFPDGKDGDVLTVEFTVLGMPFLGLNGGPQFTFDEAISFQVYTDNQAETDRYWHAIVDNGGAESDCGWCKDRFGLSWQIVPRALLNALKSPDRAAAKRAMDAMMQMQKIDIATIEAAVRG
jgi:predicted 3-demethylubiquinone-9 3-methyltransferase (glyoxalase superfamily)